MTWREVVTSASAQSYFRSRSGTGSTVRVLWPVLPALFATRWQNSWAASGVGKRCTRISPRRTRSGASQSRQPKSMRHR